MGISWTLFSVYLFPFKIESLFDRTDHLYGHLHPNHFYSVLTFGAISYQNCQVESWPKLLAPNG